MPRFLSAQWLDQLAAVVRDDEELQAAAAGLSLTVQQVVTGGPDGDVTWFVRLTDGKVEIAAGRDAHAEVVITQTHETATAVARGGLSPAEAFSVGRLKLGGQVGLLVQHQSVFARLGSALAGVHDVTSYP